MMKLPFYPYFLYILGISILILQPTAADYSDLKYELNWNLIYICTTRDNVNRIQHHYFIYHSVFAIWDVTKVTVQPTTLYFRIIKTWWIIKVKHPSLDTYENNVSLMKVTIRMLVLHTHIMLSSSLVIFK